MPKASPPLLCHYANPSALSPLHLTPNPPCFYHLSHMLLPLLTLHHCRIMCSLQLHQCMPQHSPLLYQCTNRCFSTVLMHPLYSGSSVNKLDDHQHSYLPKVTNCQYLQCINIPLCTNKCQHKCRLVFNIPQVAAHHRHFHSTPQIILCKKLMQCNSYKYNSPHKL